MPIDTGRRAARIGVLFAALAVAVVVSLVLLLSGSGSSGRLSAEQLGRAFGLPWPAHPLVSVPVSGGVASFVSYREAARRFPCIGYRGGGACFVAVGKHCGWAVEVADISVNGVVFAVGAAGPQTARIRFGRAMSIASGPLVPAFGVRMFAVALPLSARRVPPDEIVAVDQHGRLLGRQHDNDGHGSFGAMDGLIDRGCTPRRH